MIKRHAQPALRPLLALFALVAMVTVSGCARTDPGNQNSMYFDPYEAQNRKVHEFNKGLDKAVLRPAGVAYTTVVPHEFVTLFGNFAENLSTPSYVVNDLLQLRLKEAFVNTARFVLNTTVGMGGLVDAGSAWGIPEAKTDFGETLYVWGAPEGAYLSLPALGPSTERDAFGTVVDFATNPLSYMLGGGERWLSTGSKALKIVGERGENKQLFDSVLYDSADSYASLRGIYLQNRRFKLGKIQKWGGKDASSDTYQDPYADPYGDSYSDPYSDPYSEQ